MDRKRFSPVAKTKNVDETDAWKFLMKRGLSRDRANYVQLLIRFRQEAALLRKGVRDKHVSDCLDGMCEIIGDEVSEIYEMQQYDGTET